MTSRFTALFLVAACLLLPTPAFCKDTVSLVLMVADDPLLETPKYDALSLYIRGKSGKIGGINLLIAKDYLEAVQLFQSGEAQGMFAGSFVGAVLLKKGLAKAVARPVHTDGTSTYKALVVAKKGTANFSGIGDFSSPPGARRKIIAYCALASSGEIFVRSLLPSGVKPEEIFSPYITASHDDALQSVALGVSDYAIIKNTLWDATKYPELEVVGSDDRENPNGTLLLTPKAYDRYGDDLQKVLTGLEKDNGEGAVRLKAIFGCKGFILTNAADFSHTYLLMEKAHVDAKTFDFAF